ncbi:uncharacterized protein At3g17950-like [Hibiscus syriacus]|uniref:uncharacterized protein At3g17950-like n=1 Tax=Hibiscus syriacus TaxID=106335 RepID=UPI0019233965|nr:uncharacterized protein At3g17950-like [Hibiscus syriacus]
MLSTGSFFHEKSITLGNLIGVSSILELSRRSIRGRQAEGTREKRSKNNRSKVWRFSLCSRDDTQNASNVPSLGHFLAVERRAAGGYRRGSIVVGPDEPAPQAQPNIESNSLFINGCIAPPRTTSLHVSDTDDGNSHGVPVMLSCICGQP